MRIVVVLFDHFGSFFEDKIFSCFGRYFRVHHLILLCEFLSNLSRSCIFHSKLNIVLSSKPHCSLPIPTSSNMGGTKNKTRGPLGSYMGYNQAVRWQDLRKPIILHALLIKRLDKFINYYDLLMRIAKILLLYLLIILGVSLEIKIGATLEDIAIQLAKNVNKMSFDMKTSEGFNMDCLKAIKDKSSQMIGVFHSGIEQKTSGYNALYLAKKGETQWNKIIRLSERGSQGYIYQVPNSNAYLILYQLENHQSGNTVAVRYYQNKQKLIANNFLYEYQLAQTISSKKIINIGTPSVESIQVTKKEADEKYNQYALKLKFHFSPDGSHDLPGYGSVNFKPLRDFVDKQGNWIGGCKQNYSDWSGIEDTITEKAIRKIGLTGKIGQRDLFQVSDGSSTDKYYLYEVNMNLNFDWRNWRIVLYSERQNRAVLIPFSLSKVIDLANPHISLLSQSIPERKYEFWISFFIPSEGMVPDSDAKAGQFSGVTSIIA